MGKKLLERQREENKRWARAARIYEQQFCCDMMQITLGRMGWGEKRLKDFEEIFSAAYIEYDDLREADGLDDRDNWYFIETLDKELKQYAGNSFVPYEERHHLKEVKL